MKNDSEGKWTYERAEHCVNAAQGIDDLEGFIEQVHELISGCNWGYIHYMMNVLDTDQATKQLTRINMLANDLNALFPTNPQTEKEIE